MKKLILAILLLPVMAMATITAEEEFALNRLSGVAKKYSLGTLLGKTQGMVVGKYDFAVQGGAVSDINLLRDLNDSASTVVLPDNAIVTQVWTDSLTAAAGGSVAVKANATADLVAAVAASALTGIQAGVPTGSAATMVKMTAERTVKLSITNAVVTAGKFNVYIGYVLGD